MDLKEKQIEKRIIYKGRILNLRTDTVELANGNTAYREVVEHSGGACVLAVNGKAEICLIRQYRYPYDEILFELPAGKLNPSETPEQCAIRELQEETGLAADKLTLINILYPSPGYSDEKIYIYLTENFIEKDKNPDCDELIETEFVPFEKALNMVIKGEIRDAKTVAAIYAYALMIPLDNGII